MIARYNTTNTILAALILLMTPLSYHNVWAQQSESESVHKVYKDMYEFRHLITQLEPSMRYLKTMFTTSSSSISGMFMSKSIYAMLKQSVVWEFAHFPFDKIGTKLKTKTMQGVFASFNKNLSLTPLFELWRELKNIEITSDGKDHLSIRMLSSGHRIVNIDDFPESCESSLDPCAKVPCFLAITKDLTLFVTVLQEFIVMRTKGRLYPSRVNRSKIISEDSFRTEELLTTVDAISELPIKEMIQSAFRAVELFSELLQVIQENSGMGVKEWLMKECLNEFPLAVYVVIVNTMKVINERPASKPQSSFGDIQ